MKKLTVIAILAAIAMAVLDIAYQPVSEPDVVCTLTNQNIVWEK